MTATARSLRQDRGGQSHSVRHGVQILLGCVAVLATAGGVVALVAPPPGPASLASAGQAGPFAAILVLAAAVSFVAVGGIAWFGRSRRGLALVALLAAAAWMGLELEGSASVAREARGLGMVLAPLFAPLAVHLPLRALGTDGGRGPIRLLLAALYVLVALAAVGHAVTYDPFFDVHCSPSCTRGDNVLVLQQDAWLAATFASVALAASLLGGLGLVAWALLRIRRGRPGLRRLEALLQALSVPLGAALVWWAAARLIADPDRPTDADQLLPALSTAVAVTMVTVVSGAIVVEEIRRAQALRLIAERIRAGAASTSLRSTLARTLDDSELRVAYPLEDGGYVDELGLAVEEPTRADGRAVTTILRGSDRIALVEHDAGLDPELLDQEIGAAARLAVDNERLEATIRARLRELQVSRARIVAAGDQARSRLERDLHDGAQQRLLAVSFALRLADAALAQAGGSPALRGAIDEAVTELDGALADLRELAHGIHPVVLREAGLAGALASLADASSVPVSVAADPDVRCAAPVELAAYLVAVEAIRQAEAQGVDEMVVSVEPAEGQLGLSCRGAVPERGRWLRLEDRVGAAGGRLRLAAPGAEPPAVTVELPCA